MICGSGGRRDIHERRAGCHNADAGLAGQPAIGRSHERRSLLMARQNQLDRGLSQTLHDIKVLFTGNSKDAVNTFVLKRGHKKIRPFWHFHSPDLFFQRFNLTSLEASDSIAVTSQADE